MALVNALEQSSYRCELWIVSLAQGRFGTGSVKVRLKRADEPMQLDALAFCFANPALHRWLMFSIRTGVRGLAKVLKGVGGSIDIPADEQGDIYVPAATTASQWGSVEQAERWVLERLREQGVAIEAA